LTIAVTLPTIYLPKTNLGTIYQILRKIANWYYAVWTGIGAGGTFLVGVWFFGDVAGLGKYLGVILIIAGAITLKLSH
jgi:hypothetical protein